MKDYQVNIDFRMRENHGDVIRSLLASPDQSRVAVQAAQVDIQSGVLKQKLNQVIVVA